ncbi:MAG: mobile mystery protein B [Alphaproteobacteria bacterium]|nr:mobile mystery protein B [Alphaproteobacteria bacterium]MBE8220590.1 mobile mystery protein B [Alphaproteobacteria bacterium]
MDDLSDIGEGQTRLDPNESAGLIPAAITREDLNTYEYENIAKARARVLNPRTFARADIFEEGFVCTLHKNMFGDVWRWAGQYRTTQKNIGIEAKDIRHSLYLTLDDAKFWSENKTYNAHEIAVRLHHRLVAIHLFPNGNGRHARLMADVVVAKAQATPLTWGVGMKSANKKIRKSYIDALRTADAGDIAPLLDFSI